MWPFVVLIFLPGNCHCLSVLVSACSSYNLSVGYNVLGPYFICSFHYRAFNFHVPVNRFVRAVASLLLPGGQDKNISSIFPHFPVVSHFSLKFSSFSSSFRSPGWEARPPGKALATPLRFVLVPLLYLAFCSKLPCRLKLWHEPLGVPRVKRSFSLKNALTCPWWP